ncbi:hypothetical protein FKM82_013670 [Ascaphus truei]
MHFNCSLHLSGKGHEAAVTYLAKQKDGNRHLNESLGFRSKCSFSRNSSVLQAADDAAWLWLFLHLKCPSTIKDPQYCRILKFHSGIPFNAGGNDVISRKGISALLLMGQ